MALISFLFASDFAFSILMSIRIRAISICLLVNFGRSGRAGARPV